MNPNSGVRLAELMASLSVATDFAMGQPADFALASCLFGMRLAETAGLSLPEQHDVYYQSLLRYIGCNADTHVIAAALGDELAVRGDFVTIDTTDQAAILRMALRHIQATHSGASKAELLRAIGRGMLAMATQQTEIFNGHCEVAQRLGERLGFGPPFIAGLGQLYARWDGKGTPPLRGEAISPAVRVTTLAQDMVTFHRTGGADVALAVAEKRRAKQYDPTLVDVLLANTGVFSVLDNAGRWEAVLALEPTPQRMLSEQGIDNACLVLADFADIKSPWLLGHTPRVAELAVAAAASAGCDAAQTQTLRRAALLHDVGRVGVSTAIWGKPAALSDSERDQVRMHAVYTERVLARLPSLTEVAQLASSAHERCDGSGYFRCSTAMQQSRAARILTAAE